MPMTFLYEGNTTSLDDSIDKAVNILAFVESSKFSDACPSGKKVCVETLSRDLSLGRSISLTRFSKKPNTRRMIYYNLLKGQKSRMTFYQTMEANVILKFAKRSKIKNDFSSNYGDNENIHQLVAGKWHKCYAYDFFYKGNTTSLDESIDKAINILAFVENSKFSDECPSGKKVCVETLSGDQHLIRRNSMLGFSEKQKERKWLENCTFDYCYWEMVANFNVSSDKVFINQM
uniref:Uncharacterized protein n=1 Tax=Solanum lycopersicum TaxID=4081 RepID=K4ATV6_SOLLC